MANIVDCVVLWVGRFKGHGCVEVVTQRGDLHFEMPTLDRRRCGRAAGCEGCLGASTSERAASINWLSVSVMADRTS